MTLVRIPLLVATLAAVPFPVPCLLAQAPAPVFAPGVVSTGNVFGTTFSADGRTVWFNRSARDRSWAYIHQATRTASGWSTPVLAPFSGTYRDIDPFVTPDGRQMVFNSTRPLAGGDSAEKTIHIWIMDRDGDGWGAPRPIRELARPDRGEYFATMAANGTLYYTVHPTGTRNSAIARAPRTASGWGPEELITAFDSDSGDGNPLVAPDESFVIFVSSRVGGRGGADLYISFREANRWTAPQRLGDDVNTDLNEFAPGASRDWKTLYFTRMSVGPEGKIVEENIHSVPFDARALRRRLAATR